MTDPKADAIDPRKPVGWTIKEVVTATRDYSVAAYDDTRMPEVDEIMRNVFPHARDIEELESAAALAGNIAIEEAAKVCETPYAGEQDDITMEAKDRAAARIRSLSKPIDRNALIERGARAMADYVTTLPAGSMDAPFIRSHRIELARAILSAWIGEEKE